MCSQREWFEELKPSSGTVSCAAKSSLLEVAGQYVSDFIPTVSNIFVTEMEETETDIKLEETERAIDDQYPEFRRSQRERKPPVRYPFNEALSATNEELT
ncbi:hypothetical protein AVEN_24695-1 [Araneus ventricosus]|uniref:Uncharacterized protein n=1 Tax=Araneus ventricosus TaxID=182803 RepID=A0A4Y2RBN9_ARAVE|nr:hypothetical protein AVEN_24695-1 [Araneus ventricosus]